LSKLPSFQFYPGDWMKDPALRSVSLAARGLYIDLLCLMWECPERGVLKTGNVVWEASHISHAIMSRPGDTFVQNCDINVTLKELVNHGVVTQRNSDGAIISRRMVREELERINARERQARHRDVTRISRQSNNHSSSSTSVTDPPNPPAGAGGNAQNFEVSWKTLEGLVVITVPKGRRVISDADKARLAGKRADEIVSFFQSKGFLVRLEREEDLSNAAGSGG